MNKRLVLAMAFLFGLPVMAGKIRASNIEVEYGKGMEGISYMMGMSYREALEEGEITNCFSWREEHTAYEIKALPVK